jgi:hypothetical protein
MHHPSPRSELLFRSVTSRGLRVGREDSFKLYRRGMIEDRVLLGTPARDLSAGALLEIGAELGMPECYRPLLLEHFARANMVLLGLEDREDGGLFKLYLEFWDEIRARVLATRSAEPGLLNLGVKWDTRSGSHCRADYVCFPLLSVGGIVGRVGRLYDGSSGPSREFSVGLIRQAAARGGPGAAFVYLEVGEAGSPRKSFDVNLYKAEMTVADARPLLEQLVRRYGIGAADAGRLLGRVGGRVLGHLSGGVDRHGRDYVTIYYEIAALTVPPQ